MTPALRVRRDGVVLIDRMPSDLRVACDGSDQRVPWWVRSGEGQAVGPFATRRRALDAIRALPASWLDVRKGRVAS